MLLKFSKVAWITVYTIKEFRLNNICCSLPGRLLNKGKHFAIRTILWVSISKAVLCFAGLNGILYSTENIVCFINSSPCLTDLYCVSKFLQMSWTKLTSTPHPRLGSLLVIGPEVDSVLSLLRWTFEKSKLAIK